MVVRRARRAKAQRHVNSLLLHNPAAAPKEWNLQSKQFGARIGTEATMGFFGVQGSDWGQPLDFFLIEYVLFHS